MRQRATKIIATIGPSSFSVEILRSMILAGVDTTRLNFSHGNPKRLAELAFNIRNVALSLGKAVAIISDLQGPKIRIGKFKDNKVNLKKGQNFVLDTNCEIGNNERVGLDYKDLPKDVEKKDILYLNDGLIALEVESVLTNEIFTVVKVPGELTNNKGINKRGGGLSANALTAKDMEDIKIAMSFSSDYIAVSFPKDATDMILARQLANVAGESLGYKPQMIAKIERAESIPFLKDILEVSDGVMVARGDLAVEVGNAAVPAIQKKIISMARNTKKIVITATQMMESMTTNIMPTRAEVSDVANAVLDGTDAVMTSAETAVGKYPVETIEAMSDICLEAEKSENLSLDSDFMNITFKRIDESIAYGALFTAYHLRVKAIIALTESGSTPLWMSRHKIDIPIYAITPSLITQRKVSLFRNVYPLKLDLDNLERDSTFDSAKKILVEKGFVKENDMVVITWGEPMGRVGGTNALKISRINKY